MSAERQPAIFERLEWLREERKILHEEQRQAQEVFNQVYNTLNTLLDTAPLGFHDFNDSQLMRRGHGELEFRFKDLHEIKVNVGLSLSDKSIIVEVVDLGEHVELRPAGSEASKICRHEGKWLRESPSLECAAEYKELVDYISETIQSHPELQISPAPAAS